MIIGVAPLHTDGAARCLFKGSGQLGEQGASKDPYPQHDLHRKQAQDKTQSTINDAL